MSKKVLKPTDFGKCEFCSTDVEAGLSDEQKQELATIYEEMCTPVKEGRLIKGSILAIDHNGVLVDINYKSQGLIPQHEFSEYELKGLKVGEALDVIISELENLDGFVGLSYEKAKALKAWEKITKLFSEGKPVEGVVTHTVKGGLSVDIGVPAFLPGSQVDIQRVTDFDQFIGRTIIAEIIKINKKRGNVIISRRKHLAEERVNSRRKVMETLQEGQVVQGVVKNITNYGVFIDIGGIDGLLHITDMTWGRIAHPSELVKIGETVSVKVLSIDKENSKISLGMKQLTENPWAALDAAIQVGSKIKGKISSITDYGLFVEVQPGVEGLVHISEVSWTDRVENLNNRYKVGDEIEVFVVSLDKDNHRMSLSVKQLQDDPWKSVKGTFSVGQKISGPITNITEFGIFIQLVPGVDGLAHVSDLSWTEHIEHPSSLYKKGDVVEAVILGIDEESKKISLGVKQLATDPLEAFTQQNKVGSILEGEIVKFANIGAFAKLSDGIEGLLHSSEIVTKDGKKATRDGVPLEIGTKRQFRIININREERKIDLSSNLEPKKVEAPKEKAPAKKEVVREESKKRAPAPQTPKAKTQLQLALERLEKSDFDLE
jgi:small subunit ribosomal protein S1